MSHNLPPQLMSFVGRKSEVAEILALLAVHRLVTIVASGGVGKTRVSLEVAAHVLDAWSDGVWFIELAHLCEGENVAPTVARAMGVALGAEGDPVQGLARALAEKRALLVLDSCEHIIEPAAHLVATILRQCAQMKLAQQCGEQRALGNTREEQIVLMNLAENEHSRGRTQRAIAIARENLPGLRPGANTEIPAAALCNLAAYLVAVDDLGGGCDAAIECIALLRTQRSDHARLAVAIELLEPQRSKGMSQPRSRRLGCDREPTETMTYRRLIRLLSAGLDPGAFARRTAEGAAYSAQAAIALAVKD